MLLQQRFIFVSVLFLFLSGASCLPPPAQNSSTSTGSTVDRDDDGSVDVHDNCPWANNPDQLDFDQDGDGDACDDDDDNDGISDGDDNCQFMSNRDQANSDGNGFGDVCDPDDDNDGVSDSIDNCIFLANPSQINSDSDAYGNDCDSDDDNDYVLDGSDNCPFVANTVQRDWDRDGTGDACDEDDDNDGVADGTDNCSLTFNEDQWDADADGLGDLCDASTPLLTTERQVIYDDAVQSPWVADNWSCNLDAMRGLDLAQTSIPAAEGNLSMHMQHMCDTGWDAFGFDRRLEDWSDYFPIYPNQMRYVTFYFNPGSDLEGARSLQLTLDNGSDGAPLTKFIPEMVANTWHFVRVPIPVINRTGARFSRFYFFNASLQQLSYSVDDVVLEWVNDNAAPNISNVVVSDYSDHSAVISWNTNEYALGSVQLSDGSMGDCGTDYTLDHRVTFDSLLPDTLYTYTITASDHQEVGSPNRRELSGQFRTLPADLTPPKFRSLQIAQLTSRTATVCFSSDESVTAQLNYGLGELDHTLTTTSLKEEHCEVIKGLTPSTRYYLRAVIQDASGNSSTSPTYDQAPLNFTTLAAATATLEVDASVPVAAFSADMRGVNLGNWTFYWARPYPNDSPKLKALTKLIKPGVLRYAGGLASNAAKWDRRSPQCYPAQYIDADQDGSLETWCVRTQVFPAETGIDYCTLNGGPPTSVPQAYSFIYQAEEMDSLAAFADAVGADVMVEVNVNTCDPSMWADMVRYTKLEHHYPFKYWELGNELDLLRASGKTVPVGDEYVRRFKLYQQAMKSVDQSIQIVGPTTAAHEESEFFRSFTDYVYPLLNDLQVQNEHMLDVFSVHYYPLWNHEGREVSVEDMMALGSDLDGNTRIHAGQCITSKRSLLNSQGYGDVPIALTEFNAIAADTFTSLPFNHANALYMADMLGRLAYSGAAMALHWELFDHPTTTSYGLISHNDSTLVYDSFTKRTLLSDNFAPMPVFYTFLLYAQFFGDTMVQSQSSAPDAVSIWASSDSSDPGHLKIMVVNLSSEVFSTTLKLKGFSGTTARQHVLMNNDFALADDKAGVWDGTTLNGLQIDSSSAASITASFAAIEAAGTDLSVVNNQLAVTVAPYSVSSLIISGQFIH